MTAIATVMVALMVLERYQASSPRVILESPPNFMKKFLCNIVHQKFNMSHNVLMEFLSRGPGLELMKQKMDTNQIKSMRRTKKMGPTINEHINKKTYLKN